MLLEPVPGTNVVAAATHDIVAEKPALTVLPSLRNRTVKGPTVEVIVPGNAVPENVPNEGEAMVGPSKISTKSQPDSVLNAVKTKRTILPAVAGLIVITLVWLLA
jgi:hypothetical protein